MSQTYTQSQEIQTLRPVKRKSLDRTTPEKYPGRSQLNLIGHFHLAFRLYAG